MFVRVVDCSAIMNIVFTLKTPPLERKIRGVPLVTILPLTSILKNVANVMLSEVTAASLDATIRLPIVFVKSNCKDLLEDPPDQLPTTENLKVNVVLLLKAFILLEVVLKKGDSVPDVGAGSALR